MRKLDKKKRAAAYTQGGNAEKGPSPKRLWLRSCVCKWPTGYDKSTDFVARSIRFRLKVLLMKGNVRDARKLHSMTLTSFCLQMN